MTHQNQTEFKIIDTFRIDQSGFHLKNFHLQRTLKSLKAFNSLITSDQIEKLYNKINTQVDVTTKCRIEINPFQFEEAYFEYAPLESLKEPYTLSFSKTRMTTDQKLKAFHKTNDRSYWEIQKRSSSTTDIIGLNEDHFITETSRFNIFIFDGNQFYTPPVESGCLPGCFRQFCLEQKMITFNKVSYRLIEKNFLPDEIKNKKIILGNSLRGLFSTALLVE